MFCNVHAQVKLINQKENMCFELQEKDKGTELDKHICTESFIPKIRFPSGVSLLLEIWVIVFATGVKFC